MKQKLLIVDNEPVLASAIAALLAPDRYLILMARDGLEASGLIAAERPDIMISDLVMPGMDGYRLLQWVRKRDFRSTFILMTVKTSVFDPMERGCYRPDCYLAKPFDRQDLLNALSLAGARLDG